MKNGGKRQKTSISARFWVRKHPKSGRNAQQMEGWMEGWMDGWMDGRKLKRG